METKYFTESEADYAPEMISKEITPVTEESTMEQIRSAISELNKIVTYRHTQLLELVTNLNVIRHLLSKDENSLCNLRWMIHDAERILTTLETVSINEEEAHFYKGWLMTEVNQVITGTQKIMQDIVPTDINRWESAVQEIASAVTAEKGSHCNDGIYLKEAIMDLYLIAREQGITDIQPNSF